jgi:hypothetical protein
MLVGGTSFSDEKKLSVAQLVAQLDSIDPKLRAEAANQLAQQPTVSVTRGTESMKILGSAETGVDLSVVIEKLRELTKDPSSPLPAYVFAQSITENFRELAVNYKDIATMESLMRLAILFYAMEGKKELIDLQFWLEKYQTAVVKTPDKVPILHVKRNVRGQQIDMQFGGENIQVGFGGGNINIREGLKR